MLKIAMLMKNPLAHRTQWGSESKIFKKIFIRNPKNAISKVKKVKPDCIFVNKQFDQVVVDHLVKLGYPLMYFYGDYRNNLGQLFNDMCQKATVSMVTWYRSDIFKKYNIFRVTQGVDIKNFYPIPESPEIYDVVFTGHNAGGDRVNLLTRLNSDFNLRVVGNRWPKPLKVTPKKGPYNTNNILSLGKVNIGLFNFEDLSSLDYYTSNRLYQGMASGKPHIGPHTSKLKSLFRPEDGYMSWRTYDDMRDKIKYLLSHPAERKRVGHAQRSAIEREFTIEHAWARMENIICDHL